MTQKPEIRLTSLNPGWLSYGGEGITTMNGQPVPHRERIGVHFDCPCGNGETVAIIFSNPEDGQPPYNNQGGPTWTREGTTFETLSLTPSLQRNGGCRWHGYLTNGVFRPV